MISVQVSHFERYDMHDMLDAERWWIIIGQ